MERRRRSIRLKAYDYTRAGAYFVTICVQNRERLLGEVVNDEMRLNEYGRIVEECWRAIPQHFARVEIDEFIVMPNHIHGILVIDHHRRGTACRAPTAERFGKPVSGSLPTIIRSFKSASTKHINALRGATGATFWQRNYYEHVIRSDADLRRVREYINHNPVKWPLDRNNPHRPIP